MKPCSTPAHLCLTVLLAAFATPAPAQVGAFSDSALIVRLGRFAPASFTIDTSKLATSERQALGNLIAAGKVVEEIYLTQMWAGNIALLDSLSADTSAGGKLRQRYFSINQGPWSISDRMQAFLPGVPGKKPLRANLYPDGLKRADWGVWFIGLDARRQAEAAGPWHVVRWDSGGSMKTVPYSEEYRALLGKAGGFLNDAAAHIGDAGTKEQLRSLVEAFGENDFRESDPASIAANGTISLTIGATNGSLDELFRYKKAFEVVVAVRDEPETRRMKLMERSLPAVLQSLGGGGSVAPGSALSLRIDNAVYIGGGARAGAVASTVRLTTDSTLTSTARKKTILLRNVLERNFTLIQAPIAAALLDTGQADEVSFDAFFLHLVMRELSHRFDRSGTPRRTPTQADAADLLDPAPAFAEVKADLAGLAGIDQLAADGVLPATVSHSLYQTQVSSLLRALRFGSNDPFVAGAAIQFNYHRVQGAITYDSRVGRYRVEPAKMGVSVKRLFKEISTLQTDPDPARTAAFNEKYNRLSPEIASLAERLAHIPFDLEPSFPLAD